VSPEGTAPGINYSLLTYCCAVAVFKITVKGLLPRVESQKHDFSRQWDGFLRRKPPLADLAIPGADSNR